MRLLSLLMLLAACGEDSPGAALVSSSIALDRSDRHLWVVNPDSDSISVIDTSTRALVDEIALGDAPSVDATTKRFDPKIRPRALAILPDDSKVYVAGQGNGTLFVIDGNSHQIRSTVMVGTEPVAVIASNDAVYVVNHQSATVSKIDPRSDRLVATLDVGEHPWGASLEGDSLYVSQFLLHPGVTVIDTKKFAVKGTVEIPEQPAGDDKIIPNGLPRGVYAAVPRPGSGELWLPHLLLAVNTPQPELDFQSTVFPTISLVDPQKLTMSKRLLFAPLDIPNAEGSFTDVISGPRAIAFTPDGRFALVANAASEDVMIFDGETGNEVGLVRPLPSTMLEGIVVDRSEKFAYVDGRNSHDVTVLALHPNDPIAKATVEVSIDRLKQDPMPPDLRLGQRLFYSANSSAYPLSRNFWVACSTCHLEGGTDAVTWKFNQGPRDTPSNAGGPINTGFLFRQALRNSLVDYDKTINVEQGGSFHRDSLTQQPLLDALAAFVNFAIPFPQNPNVGGDAAARGKATFDDRCSSCHSGDYLTDSGAGNPMLDLAGEIVLHDVGTCVTSGDFPDKPEPDDIVGLMHTACDFDTPTLRGIFASAPYFHDGSAATLRDVVDRLSFSSDLSDADKNDLVAYLKTL